jgi:hypothetical protein
LRIVNVPKRQLIFAVLAVVALIGVILVVVDIEASSSGDKTSSAVGVMTDDPASSASITLTEAEVEAANAAAGHALGEIMRLDHIEGREAWEARIEPLCTEDGLSFWAGPLFADQVWPTVTEREYATQEIKVVDARVIGGGDVPDSVVVEVTLTLTYVLGGSDEPIQEESINQVVMVDQDGQWLAGGPPAPSYWSSEQ